MKDEAQTRVFDAQSDEAAPIIELINVFRSAVAAHLGEDLTPDMASNTMTAAVMFAGTMFGTAIAAGLAAPQDKRRCIDAMARNFRSGIDVGQSRAERLGMTRATIQ